MKIKLIRYPYKDYELGEVVDLGIEKNESMVSIQRAVWFKRAKKKKRTAKSATASSSETSSKTSKKIISNKLAAAVQKKKKQVSTTARGSDGKFVSKKK